MPPDTAWCIAWGYLESSLGRGTLIDKRHGGLFSDEEDCAFCGALWHVSYIDLDWDGDQSSPDDVFECPQCGATATRRDFCGGWHGEWDKDSQ